ncbi:1-hydroxycarotenoid 3,4-desaturase CrtD [Polyangium sp. 6x1]|uniref:1-hydroxycarotenoid 3,4-desaturase CrtD n=1 Tax=Polyangium sp. 6x1 TaxID=3042689 RepID=UPI0024826FB1|nr:1-hydroxycarotenoid 3,4-desaturase CrtD [Polyangium sp. 6x1]MDI1450679.1 phytoene desaturase family protein [Polyangium sp. 6x1]
MADRTSRALVIGAGVGGLVSALELARRGIEVVVLERAPKVGGKMRQVDVAGRAIDAGPTVMTMRWVLEEVFSSAGTSLDAELALRRAEVLARHAWGEGPTLDLYADLDRSVEAISTFAGRAEGEGYRRFCAYTQRIYDAVHKPFLCSERPSLGSAMVAVGALGLQGMLSIDGHRTLWKALGEFFRDARLRQLFGRYATYCGSSPFLAPATLNVIAQVERDGVYLVEGGMYRVAEALARVAERLGVTIRCGEHVTELVVSGDRAAGVRLASGERLSADLVVHNGDPAALFEGMLGATGRRAIPAPAERSLSAVTWAFVAEARGAYPLTRHNVFFSKDYHEEFRDLFERGVLPREPTVYVCAQDRDDGDRAPPGPERFLCLVNAPARGDQRALTTSEIKQCETAAFSLLERAGLVFPPFAAPPVVTTPSEFNRMFPATGGALYGPASHGWKSPFVRASSRTKIPGLYLAGGAAHPGAGVPMAALSGRLCAKAVIEDLASTSRSRETVMRGGI